MSLPQTSSPSRPRKRDDPLLCPYGITDPKKGTGVLWYDVIWVFRRTGRVHWRVALNFRSNPWHTSGLQPFSWDYTEPVGEQVYPLLRVMALRAVAIFPQVERISPGAPREGELKHIGSSMDVVDYGPAAAELGREREKTPKHVGNYAVADEGRPMVGGSAPMLQITRPQIDAPVAHSDMRMSTFDLIRPPYVVRPDLSTTNKAKRENRTVVITQNRIGVDFQQYLGRYKIEVTILNPLMPAAFFYQLEDPDDLERNDFRVVILHTANVRITVKMQSGHHDKVTVGAKQYESVWGARIEEYRRATAQVPYPGEQPDPNITLSSDSIRYRRNVGSPSLGETLVDSLLGFAGVIPVIGNLLDAGQFAYAAATGEDFLGRKVSPAELAVLGAAILLPVAIPGR